MSDDVFWLSERHTVTVVELSQASGVSEELVRELVELGALSPADPLATEWLFSGECVAHVRAAARLAGDLELDTQTLALVLSFIERIEALEKEIRNLHAQLPKPRR